MWQRNETKNSVSFLFCWFFDKKQTGYDVCSKTMGGVGIALAMIVLWAASMYLFKEKKNYWITAVPATFMSAVSCTYFMLAPESPDGRFSFTTGETWLNNTKKH